MNPTAGPLETMLAVAVPLRIWRLQERGGPTEADFQNGTTLGALIAEKGDLLFHRGKKAGESAGVFNAVAQGIAVLSFAPGGITLFGQHWETKREENKDSG